MVVFKCVVTGVFMDVQRIGYCVGIVRHQGLQMKSYCSIACIVAGNYCLKKSSNQTIKLLQSFAEAIKLDTIKTQTIIPPDYYTFRLHVTALSVTTIRNKLNNFYIDISDRCFES